MPGVQIRYPALGVKGIGFHGRAFLRFLRSKSAVDAFRRAGFMGTLSTR